jgi:hypothetical protein
MNRSSIVQSALGALVLFATACSGTPNGVAADGGTPGAPITSRNACQGLGFRGATPGSVVCPGAQNCSCGGADICCLQAVDSSKGVCGPLGGCRALALQCDGPEDCNPQTAHDQFGDGGLDGGPDSSVPGTDAGAWRPAVCCLDEAQGTSGGGSSCRAAGTCSGKVLCRTDDDCTSVPGLPHCRPADYGTPGVEDRGLDGLIGQCQR